MSNTPLEVQKAIYTALVANSTLTAMLPNGASSILDGAGQDQATPYVDLGEIDEVDASSKSFVGGETNITLHVWNAASGKSVIGNIFEQIKASLNRQSLSVTGNQLIDIMYSNSRIFRDIDENVWHGVIEFRALTIES